MEISGILDKVRGKASSKETPSEAWEKVLEKQIKEAEKKKVPERYIDVGYDDIVSITIVKRVAEQTLIFFDSVTKKHPRRESSSVVALDSIGNPRSFSLNTGIPEAHQAQEQISRQSLDRFKHAIPFEGGVAWGGKVRSLSDINKVVHAAQLQMPAQSAEVVQLK